MSITDRMGGFIAARIIETKNIDQFTVSGESVKIVPKAGKSFIEINSKKNGISPTISPTIEKSGFLFSINVQISAKNPTGIKLIPFNKFIVICKNPLGKEYVFGTKLFPLTGQKIPVLSNTAAGEMGETLIFTGKQPSEPLIFTES